MPSTSFADMPTLAQPRAAHTPSPPFHRRRKSWARRIERCCCQTFAYFPLLFVYGLTTWAVYVEVDVSFLGLHNGLAYLRAGLGILLYSLANISYTIAVFTSPGSPLDPRQDNSNVGIGGRRKRGGYEGLPTYEEEPDSPDGPVPREWMTNAVTAKSTGKPRFCKKCQCVKPDRTHHCSTCGKCVLKMDHHCPWLATCVGMRNYKAFILFLVYTSLFCWLCFGVSAWWVWAEIVDSTRMEEGMRVVNTILLAVLGGIIGLVLSGFTGWHVYLMMTGQTTIESLEKTRYLSPLRKSMERSVQPGRNYLGGQSDGAPEDQPLGERLKEIHANALPGVLRPEEGEMSLTPSRNPSPIPPAPAATNSSPAQESLQRTYASLEAQRERERYNLYLDEQDSEKMPNAFNMGWKRNVLHVLGRNPIYWFLPVCNTTGDGWEWEVSPDWTEARDRIGREREQRAREESFWNQQNAAQSQAMRNFQPSRDKDWKWTPGAGFVDQQRNVPPPPRGSSYMNGSAGQMNEMQPLDRRKGSDVDGYDTSSDEDVSRRQQRLQQNGTANWNDLPDDFLAPRTSRANRSRSRGRTKGD